MAAAVTNIDSAPVQRFSYGTNSSATWSKTVTASVAFDASYPTGGYALTAANFGLASLETVKVQAVTQLGTHLALWNQATGKLQLFTAIGTEVANTTDVHTDSVVVEALGA